MSYMDTMTSNSMASRSWALRRLGAVAATGFAAGGVEVGTRAPLEEPAPDAGAREPPPPGPAAAPLPPPPFAVVSCGVPPGGEIAGLVLVVERASPARV